jgi:hypothetical protein
MISVSKETWRIRSPSGMICIGAGSVAELGRVRYPFSSLLVPLVVPIAVPRQTSPNLGVLIGPIGCGVLEGNKFEVIVLRRCGRGGGAEDNTNVGVV